MPAWLRIDLGTSKIVGSIQYYPREWTTDWPVYDDHKNGIIEVYQLFVTDSSSPNLNDWGTAVKAGQWTWDSGRIAKTE